MPVFLYRDAAKAVLSPLKSVLFLEESAIVREICSTCLVWIKNRYLYIGCIESDLLSFSLQTICTNS